MSMHKYPLEPLAAAAGVRLDQLGRHLHVSGTTWKKVRDEGATDAAADRYAVRMGFHPYLIWPEMFEHRFAEVERIRDKDRVRKRKAYYRQAAA